MQNSIKKEIAILKLSTIVNVSFALAGFGFALWSRSQSVFFDALYSFTASFFTLISARVVRLVLKEDDRHYQFGYGAFEPLFIIIRSLFIICIDLSLAYQAIRGIINGGNYIDLNAASFYTIASIIVCCVVAALLNRWARKLDSPVLRAEARSWLTDTLISASVFAAFIAMRLLERTQAAWFVPYVDPLITLVFICCVLPQFVQQLLYNMRELLTAAPPSDIQAELDAVIAPFIEREQFAGFKNYSAKRGRTLYIVTHVYLKTDRKVKELDQIRKQMVKAVKNYNSFSDVDIVFTLDPSWISLSVPSAE